MRFLVTDTNFAVVQEGKSSVQSAKVLGKLREDKRTIYFLDRLLDVRADLIPDGWKLSGAVSTIATHDIN